MSKPSSFRSAKNEFCNSRCLYSVSGSETASRPDNAFAQTKSFVPGSEYRYILTQTKTGLAHNDPIFSQILSFSFNKYRVTKLEAGVLMVIVL